MRPAWIIAQRIHLGATSADRVQQIRQRHDRTVSLDQRGLAALACRTIRGAASSRAPCFDGGARVLLLPLDDLVPDLLPDGRQGIVALGVQRADLQGSLGEGFVPVLANERLCGRLDHFA